MKLILVGCEYSGTTTLALGINGWLKEVTGSGFRLIHDHWKIPHTSGHLPEDTDNFLTPEEQAQVLALSPKLKEMHQRHSLYYHTPNHPSDENKLVIGYTVDDSVYGGMYFGYGRPSDRQDRRIVAPQVEKTMLSHEPETVMVLVRARTPDVISRPHEGRSPPQRRAPGGRHRIRGRAVRRGVQVLAGDPKADPGHDLEHPV